MKRYAVAYCRMGLNKNALKKGNSAYFQKQILKTYAQANNMEIVNYYEDIGPTAKDLKRPGLQLLIQDIEATAIDLILVISLDRIFQSGSPYSFNSKKFPLQICSVKEDILLDIT